MTTLPTQRLMDVLASLPMPRGYETCAPCWRCSMAPEVEDEREMLEYFDRGIPVFAPLDRSQPVHDRVPDAIDFITNPEWNAFPKPKIAFKQGWAGPGTEMEDENLHALVNSFDSVFAAADSTGTILNLQYFHRDDPTVHPPIPAMSKHLVWPRFFDDDVGSAVCDNATRVSKRGAATWWHLDDSGEFVMQTALNNKQHPAGTQPVKVFVYGPSGSYDWTCHDAQSDESGKIVGLQLFDQVTGEEFPPAHQLPVWTVAVLRAGGRPLISPPNIPHLVITVNDCVMVEQRRVSNYFLDEVAYLLRRVQHWQSVPILYQYLRENLQNNDFVGALVERIKKRLSDKITGVERKRLLSSLLTIARFPAFFAVPGGDPRKPIEDHILLARAAAEKSDNDEEPDEAPPSSSNGTGGADYDPERQTAAEEAYRLQLMAYTGSHGASDSLAAALEAYWDVAAAWAHGPGKVFSLGPRAHCGVAYPNSRPLFGPVRATPEAAAADAETMRRVADKDGGAWGVRQWLARQKSDEKDDVLDELF